MCGKVKVCIFVRGFIKESLMAPHVNYVVNDQGKAIFVQLSVQEWENFLAEHNRLKSLLLFKERLSTAFKEIRQIQKGEKQGTALEEFLNEL
ncbi:MAG: hypothetical protein SFV55_03270 [Haliscomenobacter sp.]|nr:hypothetical protein [Haliscomenobacter sp.]